jgi:hypothetical protein
VTAKGLERAHREPPLAVVRLAAQASAEAGQQAA